MKKFWKWKNQTENPMTERTLFLNGTIAEESWFDDDITPQIFKEELNSGSGNITVWINSPGGDCVAAAQIYNLLTDYKGNVTVKIDGIAASAASVIAMAGTKVLVSPVSMLMIHNPATMAFGDHAEMQKAIDMLGEVKESIINAYERKTGLSRAKLSHLMDAETWMNANMAVELGFADGFIERSADKKSEKDDKSDEDTEEDNDDDSGEEEDKDNSDEDDTDEKKSKEKTSSFLFSRTAVNKALQNKLERHYHKSHTEEGVSANDLRNRLDIIKKYI